MDAGAAASPPRPQWYYLRIAMQSIAPLLLHYRYAILIPLALLEGPIVAFVAGTLAALGYFNIYALGAFFFVRDVGLDGCYYALGYFGRNTRLVNRLLDRIGVRQEHLDDIRTLWDDHAGMTMLIGKLSYGIASTFIVVAGMVRMPLTRFFGYGSLVAVAQYGTLLLLGYFFGDTLGTTVGAVVTDLQYGIAVVSLVAVIYYILSRRMRTKLLAEEREAINAAETGRDR